MKAQIGKFFERVGQFFKSVFSKKQTQRESTTTPSTEPPPTPDPQMRKEKNVLICVEYEADPNHSNNVVTTRIYEMDVTSALTTNIEKLVTKINTNEDMITTVATERAEVTQQSNRVPESTPFDPNSDHKEKVPVVITGVENKAEVKKEENTDPTVVRAV